MKNKFYMPFYRYSSLPNPFKKSVNCRLLNRNTNESQRDCFSGRAFHYFRLDERKKNFLDNSKKQTLSLSQRNYSLNSDTNVQLMDNFPIAVHPNFFKVISRFLHKLIISQLDEEFDMNEFLESSKTALSVVLNALSELKFPELDGLLTSDCLTEVQKNVRAMPSDQRYSLAIDIEDVYMTFPYETKIIKGGASDEKIYFEILVVYHVLKNFKKHKENTNVMNMMMVPFNLISVYNCRFIREFTKGVNDHWIINGINVFRFPDNPNVQV